MSNRNLFALLLALLVPGVLQAQIHPVENARLHYRIVLFSVPAIPGSASYVLEVARGNCIDSSVFVSNVLFTKEGNTNNIIAELPEFGANYTWRIKPKSSRLESPTVFHHLETLKSNLLETGSTRLTIAKSASRNLDGFVFVDRTNALYDLKGNPVWFLPEYIARQQAAGGGIEVLRATESGTIIFIHLGKLFEITYDGRVLNEISVSANQSDGFRAHAHHDATKLKNGHFMVLANELVSWKKIGGRMVRRPGRDTAGGFRCNAFGTLDEYDEACRLVWRYRLSDYVLNSDLADMPPTEAGADAHLNAFYFDEDKGEVYLGCKNISRIVKVKYPEGSLLAEYGKRYDGKQPNLDQDLFCQQHAILKAAGKLFVFNNNDCGLQAGPTVVALQEDHNALYGARKVWEFECGGPGGRSRGGNVQCLPDGMVFVSLSSPGSDLLIVDSDKEVIWRARLEKWDAVQNFWRSYPTYRASMITSAREVESMILYPREPLAAKK